MKKWQEIKPDQLRENPFSLIGQEWMLITAQKEGKTNTMTAAWGGLGFLWGKNVAFLFIRPQRYTKEFVDGTDMVSLSFLGEGYRKELGYLGKVSGRDEDKIAESGLHLAFEDETPYFAESRMVMLGRKLYAQEMDPSCFIEKECLEQWYPDRDYHTVYVVEIEKVLV